jgi:hypothetical protein
VRRYGLQIQKTNCIQQSNSEYDIFTSMQDIKILPLPRIEPDTGIISNFQTFCSFKRPNEFIFSVRIGPPVLPDLSKKRLNRGSAIKSKKLGYESHSNSMVRTGTFFCMGVLIVKVDNLIFLIFLRPLCSHGRVESKTPLIIIYPSARKRAKGWKSQTSSYSAPQSSFPCAYSKRWHAGIAGGGVFWKKKKISRRR